MLNVFVSAFDCKLYVVLWHFSFAWPLEIRLFPFVILNALYFSAKFLSYSLPLFFFFLNVKVFFVLGVYISTRQNVSENLWLSKEAE